MKVQLRFAIVTVGIMGAFFGALSQSSAATKSGYKVSASVMVCDSKDEAALCLSEPQEATEAIVLKNDSSSGPSMLSAGDLHGDALTIENEALLALAVNPLDVKLTPSGAVANAQRANDQIRAVETFLQTSAPEGDLTVIISGQK